MKMTDQRMTLDQFRALRDQHRSVEPGYFYDPDGAWFGVWDSWLIKWGHMNLIIEQAEKEGRGQQTDIDDIVEQHRKRYGRFEGDDYGGRYDWPRVEGSGE